MSADDWHLILRTGFGNVFPNGRWKYAGTVLIAAAYNTGDWSSVIEYAERIDWDDGTAD